MHILAGLGIDQVFTTAGFDPLGDRSPQQIKRARRENSSNAGRIRQVGLKTRLIRSFSSTNRFAQANARKLAITDIIYLVHESGRQHVIERSSDGTFLFRNEAFRLRDIGAIMSAIKK